ncbi:hypothetical protein [Streptomyces sp. CB03238]|uniref:hypothetical protein n=1 Tax=Streptomyces sp. CB03238 TaxID=1907777 RepID=UPI000A118C2F|nr:hypothetical protein [Streptomyces sp. CB03238]ORT55068.1 hypothetical protein BKD26_33400 [Streptomyces sp. CB03238]
MTETTPYDQARDQFSRSALARLVLCDRAVRLAETAGNLAVTRYDAYTALGGRVSEALSLVRLAERLLVGAVIYERERGSSWEDIARYLDMDSAAAEERFTPEIDRWNTAFVVPYHVDETGRKRIPQLPTAAYDPKDACRRLDLWAHLRLIVEDKRAVSAGLRVSFPTDDTADPSLRDIGGWIWQRNLAAFMELLSRYVDSDFDETDMDRLALGLEATDDEDPDGWFAYPLIGSTASLEVRLANSVGSDVLSVVVAGAWSAALRLRIDTLMSALSADAQP